MRKFNTIYLGTCIPNKEVQQHIYKTHKNNNIQQANFHHTLLILIQLNTNSFLNVPYHFTEPEYKKINPKSGLNTSTGR
jgi:hypothetical protein